MVWGKGHLICSFRTGRNEGREEGKAAQVEGQWSKRPEVCLGMWLQKRLDNQARSLWTISLLHLGVTFPLSTHPYPWDLTNVSAPIYKGSGWGALTLFPKGKAPISRVVGRGLLGSFVILKFKKN